MWQCSLFGSYASAEQQIIHISPLAGFETKHGVHNYSYGISLQTWTWKNTFVDFHLRLSLE